MIRIYVKKSRRCPCGVMVKAMDCGIVDKRVRILVALLHSLSGKYPWERYPPSYGLNSKKKNGGACGVMVIVAGNGHSDMSLNPE